MSAASKYCHLKSQENWQLFFRLEHPFRKSNCRGKGWCWNEDPHKHWRQDCEEDFVLRSWSIGQDCCSEDGPRWTKQVGQTGLGHDQHEETKKDMGSSHLLRRGTFRSTGPRWAHAPCPTSSRGVKRSHPAYCQRRFKKPRAQIRGT